MSQWNDRMWAFMGISGNWWDWRSHVLEDFGVSHKSSPMVFTPLRGPSHDDFVLICVTCFQQGLLESVAETRSLNGLAGPWGMLALDMSLP